MAIDDYEWKRSRYGYVLSSDRTQITRRGDEWESYSMLDLESENDVPVQAIFAGLVSQHRYVSFDGGVADLGDSKSRALWSRRFEDHSEAALAFVSKFGFLGSGDGGSEARSEPVDYIVSQLTRVSAFYAFTDRPKTRKAEKLIRAAAGPHTVEWSIENGDLVPVPRTLIGFIWRRVAEDIRDRVIWNQCAICGKPIGIVFGEFRGSRPGYFRMGTEYCSATCRVKGNRLKKGSRK